VTTSYYWHDYETFGVDPQRDRPVQFAGFRTDLDFNPVGVPLVLYCRPARDVLPTPEACLVTGITPQQAWERGVPEAEFIAAISRELSQPGTCALGYNTLRFDDEVTRNVLYRNFYDPYEREWRNGNSRWDIIDMVRATAALRPEGIQWPKDEQGRPTFRLESLTAANGIEHRDAHDALADVCATIELAKLIRARHPRLYDFIQRHRGKQEAAKLLQLGTFMPLLHVSEKFPSERHCLAVIVALAPHPGNANGVVAFDLSFDPGPLLDLDADEIRFRLYTPARELPAGIERIPLKTVHLNRSPVLAPMSVLRIEDRERLGIDVDRCLLHLEKIKRASGIESKVRNVFEAQPAEQQNAADPDFMIYRGGFFGDADRRRMAEIRALSPAQLARRHFDFDDPRLPEMLFRYRARNWPDTLDQEEARRWERFRHERLAQPGPDGTSALAQFATSLDRLADEYAGEPGKVSIIADLREWSQELFS